MKKKKQKHRLKEIEKRSSEKEMDMMEAYTEKPVQEEVYCCHEKINSLVVSPVIDLYRGFMQSIEFLRKKSVEICKLVFQMWINCVQKIKTNSGKTVIVWISLFLFSKILQVLYCEVNVFASVKSHLIVSICSKNIQSQSENFQNSLMFCIVMWYITSKALFLHLSRLLSNCFSENAERGKRIMYCVGKILELILHLKIFFAVVKSSVGS